MIIYCDIGGDLCECSACTLKNCKICVTIDPYDPDPEPENPGDTGNERCRACEYGYFHDPADFRFCKPVAGYPEAPAGPKRIGHDRGALEEINIGFCPVQNGDGDDVLIDGTYVCAIKDCGNNIKDINNYWEGKLQM